MSAYRRGAGGPPPEAYSRVTNPERFRSLHLAALALVDRLERAFDVERREGYGLDPELERLELARPCIGLSPRDPGAAPILVAFSAFPGLFVRFGRWHTELFPNCGCDACDESADDLVARLTQRIDDVTAGRFSEAVRLPRVPLIGYGWLESSFWSPRGRSGSRSRIARFRALRMWVRRRGVELSWKPWPPRPWNGPARPRESTGA